MWSGGAGRHKVADHSLGEEWLVARVGHALQEVRLRVLGGEGHRCERVHDHVDLRGGGHGEGTHQGMASRGVRREVSAGGRGQSRTAWRCKVGWGLLFQGGQSAQSA